MAYDLLPLFGRATGGSLSSTGEGPSFDDLVKEFNEFGQPSTEISEGGIRYLINEFWTSGQRQAHSIHEVSYRACFKPQLHEVALRLDQIRWDAGEIDDPELLAFYSPRTLRHICALRSWLMAQAPLGADPNPIDDWIRMVAINRLTGHSPGFFSVYTLPPNQAASAQSQRKINERRGQTPTDRDVKKLILQKSALLLSDGRSGAHPPSVLITGSAQSTPAIATGSVGLVVTSPPFLDVVQYAEDNWLRSWFAGVDVAGVRIDQHRTVADWQRMVRATLSELARIVRPTGHIAFEVGEVRNGQVLLERVVWEAAEGLPFDRMFVMVNRQEFTKTANCWGIKNNAKGTNTNRIIVLRRH